MSDEIEDLEKEMAEFYEEEMQTEGQEMERQDESEYAPSTITSAAYVGALANWQYYWIAELQGLNIQRLNERFADTSQIGFYGRYYGDGAPVLESAFVRVKLG